MSAVTLTAPLAAENRLLGRDRNPDYQTHLATFGRLPPAGTVDLLAEIEASGLTGRGGGGFPTGRKMAAVAGRRDVAVIANGAEGEPASRKDAVLLTHNPHLVLDGLAIAARAVGAREMTIVVADGGVAAGAVARAIAERPAHEQPRLVLVPDRFVSSEESALVRMLAGGPALPTGRRPFADGILVQNVETLANVALIALYGAEWFRATGTDAEPGTALATVRGAVVNSGVVEFEIGTSLGELFDRCGGLVEPVDAVLIGGYSGRWIHADPSVQLTNEALNGHGGSLGARLVVAFPRSACGLVEVARVARYLAAESAGQCGPCVFGMPALADALSALADRRYVDDALARVAQLQPQIARRGGCGHPDGALAFVTSGLAVFADEVHRHRQGFCSATAHAPVLRTPNQRRGRQER